jgi:hypothetical protein
MVEHKSIDDTFLHFGDGHKIAGEGEPNLNLGVETTKIEDEKFDHSSKTFPEILEHSKITLIENSEIKPNFSSVLVKNRYNIIYSGELSNVGSCSIVVLNGIQENKNDFGQILMSLGKISALNAPRSLKLLGVSLFDDKAYLIFEPISTSLIKKTRDNAVENNAKYITMFYLIELTMQLHEKNISILEVKEDTILYNKNNEFRYLIPFSKLILNIRAIFKVQPKS